MVLPSEQVCCISLYIIMIIIVWKSAAVILFSVAVYDPSQIIVGLLKKLCASEQVAAKTMCKDDVTNALLVPINHLLDTSEVKLSFLQSNVGPLMYENKLMGFCRR